MNNKDYQFTVMSNRVKVPTQVNRGGDLPIKRTKEAFVELVTEEELKNEIENFTSTFLASVSEVDTSNTSFEMDEITVKLHVGAGGKLSFLGFGGVEANGSASLEIKFKKK